MHCQRYLSRPLTRRQMLARCGNGFGALALAALCEEPAWATGASNGPHYPPRVRSVIFLYMDGGVSQIDSFDPKPLLERYHGEPFPAKQEPTQFNNVGTTLKSPWKFRQYGECGIPVSDLFTHTAECIDELVVIRSMIAPFSEHQTANFFLHTGFGQQGRPSMGAWLQYGLGSESRNLPGFVVVNGGLIPSGGLDNFGSGFLPASLQGSIFRARDQPLANVAPREATAELQRRKLDLVRALDGQFAERLGADDQVEASIANFETAFQMQSAVPELVDLRGETAETLRMYGIEDEYEPTQIFGRQCLLARRLVERGVRFVELTCPHTGNDRWDAHSNLVKNHSDNAKAVDKPIAGLLKDLRRTGLLDETLVVFSGEFGRTPFAQGSDGRDHSPFGFSLWMAGGGLKRGMTFGATDDFGYHAIENRVEVHDLHATILHLLGLDHLRLTYRFAGRDMRLTDVKGKVIPEILS